VKIVLFDLNGLVLSVSRALDFMEMDFLGGVTNHSKRVAYISLMMARRMGLGDSELFDLATFALLHDNGVAAAFRNKAGEGILPESLENIDLGTDHCLLGEENLSGYPFLTCAKDVVRYHHENYDGSGPFGIAGASIPLFSRLIHLADSLELRFDLGSSKYETRGELERFARARAGSLFDPAAVELLCELMGRPHFRLDLRDDFVGAALHEAAPHYEKEMDFSEIACVTKIFSRIIDSKSRFTRLHSRQLSERAGRIASRFGLPAEQASKLRIAADLHDLGKLAVSNAILDKRGPLEPWEIEVVQSHTYFTRVSLEAIPGFEDITEWAANHHETLNGKGYPYRKPAEALDFNSRLMACLDVYQALTEERPYREPLGHAKAAAIMDGMVKAGNLDPAIVAEVESEFASES
jgi:HD-GYP domain-containing protein (c-di-GMP phosphodiesterase class II)